MGRARLVGGHGGQAVEEGEGEWGPVAGTGEGGEEGEGVFDADSGLGDGGGQDCRETLGEQRVVAFCEEGESELEGCLGSLGLDWFIHSVIASRARIAIS